MSDESTPEMSEDTGKEGTVHLTSGIVSAYLERNSVPADAVPDLIRDVYQALSQLSKKESEEAAEAQQAPAVPINKSVRPDYIVCLENGKKFKTLRRHLETVHGLTPEAYRAKWGLPANYPMVAPNYSAQRSEMARTIGLGSKKKQSRKSAG